MTLEFRSTLYGTPDNLVTAIADAWMGADGSNSAADIASALADYTDAELADECIAAWDLSAICNDDDVQLGSCAPVTWLAARGLDRDDVVDAIWRYRESYAA